MTIVYLATQESNILKIFVTYMLVWGLFFLGFFVVWNLKQHTVGLPCEIMMLVFHSDLVILISNSHGSSEGKHSKRMAL